MPTLRFVSVIAAMVLICATPALAQQAPAKSPGLIQQLKDIELQKQLIAIGVLDAAAGETSERDLRKAADWFREAYQFPKGAQPLDEAQLQKLKKAYDDFKAVTGLEKLTYADEKTKTKINLRVPVALVGRTPQKSVGDNNSEWFEYRHPENKLAIGPEVHLLSTYTPIALFRERILQVPLHYKRLELTSNEFAAVGDVSGDDGGYTSSSLVVTYKDKLEGVFMRYAKVPPESFAVPDYLAPIVATAPADPKLEPKARGWQLLMQGVSNLAVSEFRTDNDWHEVDAQPCPLTLPGSNNSIRILFGTDRKAKSAGATKPGPMESNIDPDSLFANEQGNQLHIGCAYVEPSEKEDANGVRDASQSKITKYQWLYSTPKADLGDQLSLIHEYGDSAHKRVRYSRRLSRTRSAAEDGEESSALVFIHGYNVSFKDALFTAAQIASGPNSKYRGRVYMYSWPSAASTLSYISDLDNAEQAEPFFQSFMRLLMRDADIDAVDIIAHSMGSQPAVRALSALRSVFETQRQGVAGLQAIRIGQIIFAAPDVSGPVFDEKIHRVAPYAARVTVYASLTDAALLASKLLRNGASRVGQLDDKGQPLRVELENVHVINATGSTKWLGLDKLLSGYGHDYFLQRPGVAADIQKILAAEGPAETTTPDQRWPACFEPKKFAEKDAQGNEWTYWVLKESCSDAKQK
jgi:pimeloyl-ACP methyl ester carboxylesterase